MSLRFYFGPSDGALSKKIYEDIIVKSMENPRQNFLVIVPDQFTMQTQKELCLMHPSGGILNIDVLSFGRLKHRILEEVGNKDIPVLDDTGKSLILQKVAAGLKDRLPALGGHLQKQGYIHEVKSAISEFMQYGLSPEDLNKLLDFSKGKNALTGKLKDLQTIYQSFMEYIGEKYVTAEETLDVLCRKLPQSQIVKGSVIVLDGFTGFTPIQYRLVRELMLLGSDIILTMVCGPDTSPYRLEGTEGLFALTQKTVHDLEKIAGENGVDRDRRQDIFLEQGAEASSEALLFLQRNLFRYGVEAYSGRQEAVQLFEATSPAMEVRQTALAIRELVRREGLAYRDITIICGDLEGYAPYVEAEFRRHGIPCFIDRTRGLVLNPLVEFIRSTMELYLHHFSYQAVMHYLRSGMAGFTAGEVDEFENYILALGIKGKSAYGKVFGRKTLQDEEEGIAQLNRLNDIRQRFISQVEVFGGKSKDTAKDYVERMYAFLTRMDVAAQLDVRCRAFEQQGDPGRAKEYGQIYRLVMELLEQIHGLLGDEEITLQEFSDIVEAGFGEIEVGIIPQNVDRVLVGDMERTRYKPVDTLFFLGVNDGNIPRNASKGGIISDMEREFLAQSDIPLAPSPRQQMFIQKFYLYLNMTKPLKRLYLSYARQSSDGKSLRPAYLLDTLKRMFRGLTVDVPQNRPVAEQILTPEEGMDYLARGLRDYAGGVLDKEQETIFFTLYHAFGREDLAKTREGYTRAAFTGYQGSNLSKLVAGMVYGKQLENSVSRLETFAACAYRHFLQYGLTLEERQEFGLEAVDLGNIYHGVLESFAHALEQEKKTWMEFDQGFAQRVVHEAMESLAASYGGSILYANYRNTYQIARMERILTRTVLTIQKQLKKGVFEPKEYEVSFREVQDLDSISVALSKEEKMILRGRIDRIDLASKNDNIYVKVVDYKSGDKQFDLAALYYGLQLQLVVYMNAAMEKEKKKHPDKNVLPAALLYYHVDDPVVESSRELTEEELDLEILKSLRGKGIVNEDPDIVKSLDGEFAEKSLVIPVERKKDGTYSARSDVMSGEELSLISGYVNRKIRSIGREILDGKIEANPYEWGQKEACTYCPYKKVCEFDISLPGCKKRQLQDLDKKELLDKMKEEG